VARVALLCPDLMFGSRVQEALRAAGHDVSVRVEDGTEVLVVDLTADEFDAADVRVEGLPSVGFYPHVDVETRKRALDAGYDVVVPRSRMARETAAVVEKALAA
jgi:hypothetical protein